MSGSSTVLLEMEEARPKVTFASIRERNANKQPQLTRLLGDVHDVALLEISCGTGAHIMEILASKSGSVVWGVEDKPDNLLAAFSLNQFAIRSNRCQIVDADLAHLPFSDGMFAVVYSVNQFHTWTNRWETLREARRVLTPGGILVLSLRVKGQTWLTCGGEDISVTKDVLDWLTRDGWKVLYAELASCSSISDEFWIKVQRID